MKKTMIFIGISISLLFLIKDIKAQNNLDTIIQPFEFLSFKDYDNNIRIAYFYIEGLNKRTEQIFVQDELKKNVDIQRFYVYEKKNGLNRCMIETKSSINEQTLRKLINTIVLEYRMPESKLSTKQTL